MCITEYIAYTCGHRSISVLRACPMTTHLHTNPVCPIAREPFCSNNSSPTSCQLEGNAKTATEISPDTCCGNTSGPEYTSERTSATERAFFAKTMCSPCGRIMHANWVNVMEYEHRWMHERGVCGCPVKFPALMGPRVVGAGGFHEHTEKNHDNSQRVGSGIAPLFEEHEDRHYHPRGGHDQYHHDANQTGHRHSRDSSLQVSVRLPSLYAAEWVNDHRERHDSGQCHCLVSFDEYEPTPFEEAELHKEEAARIEQVGDVKTSNTDAASFSRGQCSDSAGIEQSIESEKGCSDYSHPLHDARTEYLQAENGDRVKYIIPFQLENAKTRESSEVSSSPPEAPRKPRRTTSFNGPRRGYLKNDQTVAGSTVSSTPSPTPESALSEQFRHKPTRVPQSRQLRTSPQTVPSSHSDQGFNDRSMYFMERIIGPAELIKPVAYDDTFAPYTHVSYSSSSEGFVKGIKKPAGHCQPRTQGKRGEGKSVLKSPYEPSSTYKARHREGNSYLNQSKSPQHNPHTNQNRQNDPNPYHQAVQNLPIAGFPIGAGPENDSHAGDYELCRLKLHAYNLSRWV